MRTFRADRIRSATATEEDYEIPEDFEVGRYRREGPPEPEDPEVVASIRFDPDPARYARESFPASAFEERADGGLTATVRASGTAWLVSELLRWGGAVEVASPEVLREELTSCARETLARYGR